MRAQTRIGAQARTYLLELTGGTEEAALDWLVVESDGAIEGAIA
jgi:hypothetical protein